MADAPAWLCQAFADGVDERLAAIRQPVPAYPGADPYCWLAAHDPKRWPCTGQPGKVFERFHFTPRQRVANALGALLPHPGPAEDGPADYLLLAEWDSRNGGIACEHHHRRFDGHSCSPRKPKIVVPGDALPLHVFEFAVDYGIERQLERRFAGLEVMADGTIVT